MKDTKNPGNGNGNPSNGSNPNRNPNGDYDYPNGAYRTSGPLTHEPEPVTHYQSPSSLPDPKPEYRVRRTGSDSRDTSPPPKSGSMIVKIRDEEGHIVAVDYNRIGERWQDTATRLYNACVTPRRVASDHPRKIGHPVAYGSGFGMHRLVFVADVGGKRTFFDPAVTVMVDQRMKRERAEDQTRELPPRPRSPFDPADGA